MKNDLPLLINRKEIEINKMPLRHISSGAKPYFIFGYTGKKYYYKRGSEKSKLLAKSKAQRQGRAIAASKYSH